MEQMLWRRLMPVCLLAIIAVQCGSLTNELDRIRLRYEDGLAAPNVIGTVPPDGTVSAPLQSYADVNFDRAIDAASISYNTTTGPCIGTVAVSMDDFATCFGITATAIGSTIRIGSSNGGAGSVIRGVTLKLRISGVLGTNGVTANPYQSATGISFTSPCGQDCFYSDSAPLTAPVANGSHSFVIPSGPKSGGIIIFAGGTTNTTYYDPDSNQTSAGPAACCTMAVGAHSFYVSTAGGLSSGNVITICGGGTGATCSYNPATHTFSAGPTMSAGSLPSAGSLTIPILAGANTGNYITLAGGSTATYLFNVALNTYALTGSVVAGATAIGPASNWIRLDSGVNAGKPYIVVGNGNTNTNLFTDSGLAFASGAATIAAINGGSFSFRANAGTHANRIITAHGITTQSSAYDQNATVFAGPTLPCGPGAGVQASTLATGPRSGQTLMLCGGGTAGMSFYDHPSSAFISGGGTTGIISTNSSLAIPTSGKQAGKYFIVNGGASGNTTMYDPVQDVTAGSRLFRSTGTGSNGFAIKSGPKLGRVLLMTGGLPATTVYNPQTNLMEPGPDILSAIGAGALNFPITNGANAGMQFILQGGGTSILHKYDPGTNTFSIAAGAGVDYNGVIAAKNNGSRHFLIPTGSQANNYLILNGGFTTADYFNTTTNTFSAAGTVTGCGVFSAGSWIFRITSGLQAGKFMIICGSAVPTSLFDPSGPSFASGPSLGVPNANGSHGFYITTGSNAGKFLLILATTTATRLYDPNLGVQGTWGLGPTLCGNAGSGGFNVPITAGANAGKQLIALGGGTTLTCFFDPATNAFTSGPATGTHQGYAVGQDSLAFTLGYGTYPTAYVIIHGAQSTTFSHWFAY